MLLYKLTKYLTGQRYLDHIGAALMSLGNDKLQWQQTNKLDAGADLVLFRNYVSVTADYYVEKTNQLFTQINTAPSTGVSKYYANLGNTQNKGMELSVTAFAIRNTRDNIFLSFFVSALHNKNRLLKISDALKAQNDAAIKQQTSATNPVLAPVLQYKEGQSMSAIYAVKSLGIDPSTGYEITWTATASPLTAGTRRDEVVVGDNQPKLNSTFGANLMYKGFSFNVNMRAETGGQMYNGTLANMIENAQCVL